MNDICNICCENYNNTVHKKVICSYCNFETCKKCCKTYILSNTAEAHCMNENCKKQWTLEFLYNFFPNSFYNDIYRKHRASFLLDREKSLLPATQILAERIKKRKVFIDKVKIAEKEINLRKKEICDIKKLITRKCICIECDKLRIILREKRTLAYPYYDRRRTARHNLKMYDDLNYLPTKEVVVEEKKVFIMPCPADNCKGFLSTALKCGLCGIFVCGKCHSIKDESEDENNVKKEHICNKDDVESVILKKKETKPCPGCGTPIFKIMGCSQLFCTHCYTAFDWITLKKTNGPIHNPHYYEWMRQGGNNNRNPLDRPCGGLPNPHHFGYMDNNNKFYLFNKVLSKRLRKASHISNVILPVYRTDIIMDNQDLRIKYLLDEITEKQWKDLLCKRNKLSEKNTYIFPILEMWINVNIDLFNNILTKTFKTNEEVELEENNLLAQLDNLDEYAEKELIKIRNIFKNTVPSVKTPKYWK